MLRLPQRHPLPLAFAALALLALPAAATTIVPMRDSALVDRARLVVVAETVDVLPVVDERPATDYLMRIERVLKGEVAAGSLVVRVPGGFTPDGRELRLYGAPRFQAGERALLFLGPERDGSYRILQFLQGAFHRARLAGRDVAYRDESEVQRLAAPVEDGPGAEARDFEKFADWIADRAAGIVRGRDYLFHPDPVALQGLTESFTLFESGGLNLRWIVFDTGGSVTWKAHRDGQPGLAGGGFTEFQRALTTWNNETATPIRLTYGGTTSASAGFQSFDNQNVLLFNDPNGDIEGKFDCGTGGTLAIGGPWSDSSDTRTFNGKRYVRIQGGDIVMNDGIECRLQASRNGSKMAEEVYAHELGHTLGLGHSSEDAGEVNQTLRNALMFFRAHDDGRGGRLESDDIAGIRSLYQKSGSGGGNPPPSSCGTDRLCFLGGRFEATLTWTNQFNSTSGVGKAIPYSDFAGFFYFETDPRALELLVKVVDFGGTIYVFFSELTVLQFEITVVDRSTGQTKKYRNTPGDCGAIDPDFVHSDGSTALLTGGVEATIRDLGITKPGGGRCKADAQTLCLIGNRFSVRLPAWTNQFDGSSGSGKAKPMNDFAGIFHFTTDPRNLEILFKIYQFPDRFLVFYGTVSIFDYTIQLTDETTGRTTEFHNPSGTYCGGFINNLLAGPPF